VLALVASLGLSYSNSEPDAGRPEPVGIQPVVLPIEEPNSGGLGHAARLPALGRDPVVRVVSRPPLPEPRPVSPVPRRALPAQTEPPPPVPAPAAPLPEPPSQPVAQPAPAPPAPPAPPATPAPDPPPAIFDDSG
jgi:hypothetical protein